jgi:hypothetical protein
LKLPEALFSFINPVVRALLQSPIHGLISDSLMLVTYTGRKSQRRFTTPVRYVQTGDNVRCFTSAETLWWRSLRGGADVVLRLQGEDRSFHATVIDNDPTRIREALENYLELYPQDAAYHDIRLNKDKSLVAEDLERASRSSIVVEATPMSL